MNQDQRIELQERVIELLARQIGLDERSRQMMIRAAKLQALEDMQELPAVDHHARS